MNAAPPNDIAAAADPSRLDPEARLAKALGRPATPDELVLWASMPTDRRERTLARIPVLRRWVEEPGEMTAAEAARDADVAVSRWYEVAAAWKAAPVLASVGTFAKRPGRTGQRLDGEAVNRIQSILPTLVASDLNGTVAGVVTRIQADPKLQGLSLPHVNTLRTMVQRERRRQQSERQVGLRPGFDATACELLRTDGTPHVMFAVVDRTSHRILGFTVGDLSESRSAYARAAADALVRIGSPGAQTLAWADTTERIDVIVGDDPQAWARARARYDEAPIGPALGLVAEGRRFGRYLRLAVGTAIGEMRIYPARTEVREPAEGNRFSDKDAVAAIEVEVARHNAAIAASATVAGAPRPAPVTLHMLEFVASA